MSKLKDFLMHLAFFAGILALFVGAFFLNTYRWGSCS